ncbi:hypothetical protein HDV00_008943 [Rhizophlyctis rosea]|nr:hypothetical protein HDV00_008943 [Rhizophlyctis rosea]
MAQSDTRAPIVHTQSHSKPQRQTAGDSKPRGGGGGGGGGESSRGGARGQRNPRRQGAVDSTAANQQEGHGDHSSSRRGKGVQSAGGRRGDGGNVRDKPPGRPGRKQSLLLAVPEDTPVPLDLGPTQRIVMAAIPEEDPILVGRNVEIEPYMEWVTASLQAHERMELLGIDPVLPNMVAVILILRNSGTVNLERLETITLEGPDKSPRSALRAHLLRGPLLQQDVIRKQKLQRQQQPQTPKPSA